MKSVILFDYDGTLHETMRIYRPAIAEVVRWLRDTCHKEVRMPSDERISSWLGMTTADMWRDFMPDLEPELRLEAGRYVGEQMLQSLKAGHAGWYPGAEEQLDALKAAGYEMAILSNCGNAYAEAHWSAFRMDRWFTAFFAGESWNNAPKAEIARDIADDFGRAVLETPVKRGNFVDEEKKDICPCSYKICAVIGDRDSDLAAARAIRVPFIGCLYGYGSRKELEGASKYVEHIGNLFKITYRK